MTDDRWKTTFEIKCRRETVNDGDLGSTIRGVYDVVNMHNGVIVGSYREQSYAIKQARRKYKKLVKLMEKTFMSLA